MTIEEYLDCSAGTLVKMTDQELLNHFKQFFPVTRPEQAPPKKTASRSVSSSRMKDPKREMMDNLLSSFGVDLDEL